MLNALANHDFLPANGRGISLEITTRALRDGINVDPYVSKLLFDHAIKTNPDPNAATFDLDHLNRHGIIEHDASLTRPDNSSGDPSVFDPEVFKETLQYWPDPIVSVKQGAAARLGRIRTSAGTNVDFEMRLEDNFRGLGEVAGFYLTLGDRVAGTVNRTWLTYFLEKEFLPVQFGWTKPREPITLEALQAVMTKVYEATKDIIHEERHQGYSEPRDADQQHIVTWASLTLVFSFLVLMEMATSKNPFLIQNSTAGRSYGSARSLAAPLFLIHDASGNILSYLKLGFLGDARKVYGISDPHFGHEGGSWLSLDQLARHYIKLVKKVMLRGDILLGGWSFGGIVAIQMAHMLAAEGRGLVCSGLILIDTIYLSPSRSLGSGANSNLAPSMPINVTPDTRDEILVSLVRCHMLCSSWLPPSWACCRVPRAVLIKATDPISGQPEHLAEHLGDRDPTGDRNLGLCRLDAQRHQFDLGWSETQPGLVTAVIDTPGHHYALFSDENRIAELEYANVATGVKANSQYGVYIDDSDRQQFLYPKITINNTEAYVISGLHQMHCMMEMLRDYGLLVNGFRPLWNDHHVIHCFNKWYRSIACSADSTAEGYQEPFGSVPMSEIRRASWASSVPRCRDFRALVRWAEDPIRALPFHYDSGLNVTAVSRLSEECDLTKCRDEGGWKGLD
uniref:Thioesterase domain-containing protein n=1 Tax=Colletotrichum fructicola (strain Nara gc5) TaxID=1213859 RepID=L2FIA7_COLFN